MSFVRKRFQAFGYALKGLKHAFLSEAHFRIHSFAAAVVITAGFFFHITPTEWLVVTLCIVSVMAAELFNTVAEELVNLLHPESGKKAGKIKDMAAAAVLICAAGSFISGLLIFIPYLKECF